MLVHTYAPLRPTRFNHPIPSHHIPHRPASQPVGYTTTRQTSEAEPRRLHKQSSGREQQQQQQQQQSTGGGNSSSRSHVPCIVTSALRPVAHPARRRTLDGADILILESAFVTGRRAPWNRRATTQHRRARQHPRWRKREEHSCRVCACVCAGCHLSVRQSLRQSINQSVSPPTSTKLPGPLRPTLPLGGPPSRCADQAGPGQPPAAITHTRPLHTTSRLPARQASGFVP